ncbi:MAG: transposase [Woeseiaceae bacterium]|nr:transposase [Woeseiaceae bacterium]
MTTSVARRRPIFHSRRRALLVVDAIRWLHATNRFIVDAAVVMPDHLHLAGSLNSNPLPRVMHSLKSYTSKQLASMGVSPPVWQRGYHDHAIRDEKDYAIRISYLIDNPVRAGLVTRPDEYPYLILPDWWR